MATVKKHHFNTNTIHAGVIPDPTTGAILTPIYQTTTYVQELVGANPEYTYSRKNNPTVFALEQKLGVLESATIPAVCFATGIAATNTLFTSLLKSGDHIVCGDVVYGGTVRLLNEILAKFGISTTYVDTTDISAVHQAINGNTKLIFIETPANPTMKLTDIKAIAKISKEHQILLVADNTFLTAALLKPFNLGADIILYSTTKYIDGHNATTGGALVCKDHSLREKFHYTRNAMGNIQAPFNAWLILQGIKTLGIRLKEHSANAMIIAKYLEQHPKVKVVNYPGLPSFKQFALAQQQHLGYHGGMLSFEVIGNSEDAITFINNLKLCFLAESLGSVETLVTHPASMTHKPVPEKQRIAVGITEGLIRLSVGLEDPEDIIDDLEQAFTTIG